MKRLALLTTLTLAAIVSLPARAQTGELNLLTDLGTPFPPGCLSIDLPQQPRFNDILLVNQRINVPSVQSTSRDAEVRVQMWRVACADEDFSVVLVRLRQTRGQNPVVVPTAYADAGRVQVPFHEAQLLRRPGTGNAGASGSIVTTEGTTWMLGVQPVSIDGQTTFTPPDYNAEFTLELNWGNFSPANPEGFLFTIDQFEPAIDEPQFDQPVLNGRYSGMWIRRGAERQGMGLHIGEQIDKNFVFALFYTYLDGRQIWLQGNTGAELAQPGPVTIDPMITLENGSFITAQTQASPDNVLVSDAGSITIEPIDCNTLRVDYDFSEIGHGSGTMELDRFIRIAGYDCNPWQ